MATGTVKRFKIDPSTGDALLDANGDFILEDESQPAVAQEELSKPKGPDPISTGVLKPPVSNLRADVTFAGSEGAGKTASAVFPRTAKAAAEGQGYGKQALGAGLDLLSLPGRTLAAGVPTMGIGAPGFGVLGPTGAAGKPDDGREFLESMADTKGKNLVGKVLRDPGTGAAVLTAPVGGLVAGRIAGGVLKAAPKLLGRMAGAAGAGATEGTASAAAHQAENVQEGGKVNLGEAAAEVGLNAALPVAVLGGKSILASALKKHGEKTITTSIKPSLKDMKDGFRVQNVFKHKLEGTLEETAEKLDKKFNELSAQLSAKIKGSESQIDMLDILSESLKDVAGDKAATFGKNTNMDKAADFLLNELNEVAPNGAVDLVTAQKIKRGVGKMGSWEWGKPDPESSAREALADMVYSKLKTAIENAAPAGVKEINQQLSELIPIERAVTRRLPVEARNSGISLTDILTGSSGAVGGAVIGGGPASALGAAALFAGNRARKSPALAGKGFRLGEKVGALESPRLNFAARRGIGTGIFRNEEQ